MHLVHAPAPHIAFQRKHAQKAAARNSALTRCRSDNASANEPSTSGRVERRVLMLTGLGATVAQTIRPAFAEVYDVSPASADAEAITNLVFLDIGIAPRSFKTASERSLGDRTVIPLDDAAPVGRIVLGLYGNAAPGTVANFMRLVRSGALKETVFSKVLPGEYIQAGGQGPFRLGWVQADAAGLQPNTDMFSAEAFRMRHLRPGTVSLSLTENDEDPSIRQRQGYRNTEFLITTGPGPVPRLDSANLVFGRVVEGMTVVSTIAQVPTFKPSERSNQLNRFAQSIGDDRAAQVRRKYGKPLKAVIIQDVGELSLPTPSAAPLMTAARP